MAGDDQSVVERIHQMVVPFDCSLHPDWLWTRQRASSPRILAVLRSAGKVPGAVMGTCRSCAS